MTSSLLSEIDTHTCDETTFNLSGLISGGLLGKHREMSSKCFSTLFLASFFISQSRGALLRVPSDAITGYFPVSLNNPDAEPVLREQPCS